MAEEGLFTGAISNPASLQPENISVYAEFGYRPSTTWIYDITYDGQFILPACISVAIPRDGWNMSFGYMNFFDSRFSIADILITTTDNPDGTGETFDFERSTISHVVFGSINYNLTNILSLGITTGLQYVTAHEELFPIEANGTGVAATLIFGALIKPSPVTTIGAKFSIARTTTMDVQYNDNGTTQLIQPDTTRPVQFVQLEESYKFTLSSPWTTEIGIAWRCSPSVKFLGSLEYQRWSSVYDTYDNLLQLHFGIAAEITPTTTLRCGLFTQTDPAPTNQPFLNQNFLTAGIEISTSEQWIVSASILDSHLLSSSSAVPSFEGSNANFRQTYISMGIGYSFQ